MADITSPEAIRFVNEIVRPLAERMRGLKVMIDSALTTWNAGLNTVIGTSSGDLLEDGREDEGVSRLYASDIATFGVEMIAYQKQLDIAGVSEKISKPCVRTLEVM